MNGKLSPILSHTLSHTHSHHLQTHHKQHKGCDPYPPMESDGRDGVSDTGRKCCIFTSPVNQDLVELFHFHKPGGRQRFYQMFFFFCFLEGFGGFFWRYEQHLRAKSLHLYIFSAIAAIFYCCHAGSFNCCPL